MCVCVCVCVVLVGVNKSGGTKAHRSRSALKRMLAEQELSVLLRHGSLPPNKKQKKQKNKKFLSAGTKEDGPTEPQIHLIITEHETSCHKHILRVYFVPSCEPHLACP